jgi:hypothetical protein
VNIAFSGYVGKDIDGFDKWVVDDIAKNIKKVLTSDI